MEKLIFPLSAKEAQKMGVAYSEADNRGALFPTRLRLLRNQKGISQEALSKALGVTKSTISLYENGENVPDVKTLAKIAAYYGVSYDYLMGESDSQVREYQDISKTLGLSDKAIEVLRILNQKTQYFIPTVNYLIEQEAPMPDMEDILPPDASGLTADEREVYERQYLEQLQAWQLKKYHPVLTSIAHWFHVKLGTKNYMTFTSDGTLKAYQSNIVKEWGEGYHFISQDEVIRAVLMSEIQEKLKQAKEMWDVEYPED